MLPRERTELSPAVLQVVVQTRLGTLGRWVEPGGAPDRPGLIDTYIILKELGLSLGEALRGASLTPEQRHELAAVLETTREDVQALMAGHRASRDQDGRWFLGRLQVWTE